MAFGCCCISAALADAVLNSLDFCANSMRIAANSKFVQMCTYLQRLAPALDRYTAANFTLEAGELIISNLHERSHSEACIKARLTSSGACANGAKVNNESCAHSRFRDTAAVGKLRSIESRPPSGLPPPCYNLSALLRTYH
eukprot:1294-Heterococcus_DN1.PRE.1